jgi:DNA-directed RNA polymerase subunit K/omega
MSTPGTIRLGSKRANSAGKPRNDELVISVDRANPVLGNRHYLRDHLDSAERARVVAAYERDLIADEKVHGPMTRAIEDIAATVAGGENVILMCWCAPEFTPCHGQHIVTRVQRIVAKSAPSPV